MAIALQRPSTWTMEGGHRAVVRQPPIAAYDQRLLPDIGNDERGASAYRFFSLKARGPGTITGGVR